jgi:hypothetical protein
MLSLLTLALAPMLGATAAPVQSSGTDPVRELAWNLHQNPPTSADLLSRWANAETSERDNLVLASARGLRGQNILLPLLFAGLSATQEAAQNSGAIPAPGPALLELLAAVPDPRAVETVADIVVPFAGRQPLVGLLSWLLADPEWQFAAASTLLSWDVLPTSPDDPLMPFMLRALSEQWLPSDANLAAALELGPEVREALLMKILAEPWQRVPQGDFKSIDTSRWLDREILLLHLAQMNAGDHSAPLLSQAWADYVRNDLAPGLMQLLELNLRSHLYRLSEPALDAGLRGASASNLARARDFLLQIRPTAAADFFLNLARDTTQDAAVRLRCAQAVFLCGSERQVQGLLPLLTAASPQTLLLGILVGLRNRPDPGAASYLTELLPKLRTREAGVAVEVLILTSDHATRLQWLKKLAPLPPSASHRIAQAAYAIDPSPDLIALYWEIAAKPEAEALALATAGLREAISEKDLARGYADMLHRATEPEHREVYLNALLNLRTEAALEIILQWLQSPAGRLHPRSESIAAMMIEEEVAIPMFEVWWQSQTGLNPQQLDWAACALAPQNSAARLRLHQRFQQVDHRVQTMFLSRMLENAEPTDLELWLDLFHNPTTEPSLRKVCAHLLYRVQPEYPAILDGLLAELAATAQDANAPAPAPAWQVLMRGLAGLYPLERRTELLQQIRAFQAPWKSELLLASYRGFRDHPLATQIPFLTLEALQILRNSDAEIFNAQSRPKRETVAAAHADLEHVLLALEAYTPSAELDLDFASQLIELGTNAHPDGFGILALGLASWPQSHAAAREILAATESLSSFRYPPDLTSGVDASSLPLWTDASKLFDEIRRRYDLGQLEGLAQAASAASYRWPRDRRAHLWVGWIHLAMAQTTTASSAFQLALDCVGWLPYAQLEPNLGLAACDALSRSDFETLKSFLADTAQADKLLRGRTVNGLLPQLAELVAEPAKRP